MLIRHLIHFTGTNTAQVTPLELTTKLMDAAISKGVTLVHGTVEGIDIVDGKVTGVRITGEYAPTYVTNNMQKIEYNCSE